MPNVFCRSGGHTSSWRQLSTKSSQWRGAEMTSNYECSHNLYINHSQMVVSKFFFIFIRIPGEMIQFDEDILQMGWNHQLDKCQTIAKYHLQRNGLQSSWDGSVYFHERFTMQETIIYPTLVRKSSTPKCLLGYASFRRVLTVHKQINLNLNCFSPDSLDNDQDVVPSFPSCTRLAHLCPTRWVLATCWAPWLRNVCGDTAENAGRGSYTNELTLEKPFVVW